MQEVDYVLWDFSGTLAPEGWELEPPDGVPRWANAWEEVAESLGAAWDRGQIDGREFAGHVGAILGLSPEQVLAHVERRAAKVRLFDLPNRIVNSCRVPQALVTIIPDVFSHFVVPRLELDRMFDAIVTSWEERELDKVRLCEVGLRRIAGRVLPTRALLIDNVDESVARWEAAGGLGYWFRSEGQLEKDLVSELHGLWKVSLGAA